ncbi:hypothetical protein JXA02_05855 [candidate division KSB1 bacterium]|nr:hypothetical protein [candidate division KSB1 bacterium]RQW07653.1 MAG: hypothetical protein EH222_06760 [candidate division KSB1 bacterium]
MQKLSKDELIQLVKAVFPQLPQDNKLAIIVDVPNSPQEDKSSWAARRQLAYEWFCELQSGLSELGLSDVSLVAYPSVGMNNADLPEYGHAVSAIPDLSTSLSAKVTFAEIFTSHQLFLAPTQYSATAPMKLNAKKYGFRAATMPGFALNMMPALRIDYGLVNERCQLMKQKLDAAVGADVFFRADDKECHTYFDLRFRPGHASSGRFPDPGTAGNLPSGETFIVPYEGEKGEPSQTQGVLPVQFDDEIVLFKIQANNAVGVLTDGVKSREQADYLRREPAYGNMAELGFGILADFGLEPIGEILLDEKLAFHIAFGRSDHFGGVTGAARFSSPKTVVHIDYIYSPKIQRRISVSNLDLISKDATRETIIQHDKYLIF